MKAKFLSVLMMVGLSSLLFFSSCYTYSLTVGNGPQTGVTTKKMNHYILFGLAPVGLSDVKVMAGDAENYEVTITHTFVDGLLNVITFGIYTPTTTIVKK